MNTVAVHRMIRVFTGYGSPDLGKDGVGPNKSDWGFFSGVAGQDSMEEHQLLEAAERFHKYRNTQLPSILTDAGLIDNSNQVLRFLDKMKVRGTKAKAEYEKQQATISRRNSLRYAIKNGTERRMTLRQEPVDDVSIENCMFAYECERDEAVSIIEQFVAEWQPPTHLMVHFSTVDDTWTNRWGKQFTSKRIALTYSYNPQLNSALKNTLGFPAIKFDGGTKKWTLQDNTDVLKRAKAIMLEQGMFFDEQSLASLEVSTPPVKKSIEQTTEVSAELIGKSSIALKWPFISDEVLRSDLLNQVKISQGRKFNPATKAWTVAIS
jgi:hypothetical protein